MCEIFKWKKETYIYKSDTFNCKIRHILQIDEPTYTDTIYFKRETIIGYKPIQILKTKVKTNNINVAENIINNHMQHILTVELIDNIFDNYISVKPSIYNTIDDTKILQLYLF